MTLIMGCKWPRCCLATQTLNRILPSCSLIISKRLGQARNHLHCLLLTCELMGSMRAISHAVLHAGAAHGAVVLVRAQGAAVSVAAQGSRLQPAALCPPWVLLGTLTLGCSLAGRVGQCSIPGLHPFWVCCPAGKQESALHQVVSGPALAVLAEPLPAAQCDGEGRSASGAGRPLTAHPHPPPPCPCRNEVTKMKFEGKTFYLYVSQKEVGVFPFGAAPSPCVGGALPWLCSLCCRHPAAPGTAAVADTLLSAAGKENCPHLLCPNTRSLQAPLEVWHREPGLLQVSAGMRSALRSPWVTPGLTTVWGSAALCPSAPLLQGCPQPSKPPIMLLELIGQRESLNDGQHPGRAVGVEGGRWWQLSAWGCAGCSEPALAMPAFVLPNEFYSNQ